MKQILVVILLLISILGYSQCGNTDFELGNFTGWTAKLGTCCPIALPTNGFANTRQTIMTQGTDPHSCGGLRTVYQGMYSARLGNDRVGAQAEGLSYVLTITPATTLIKYAYAVVFQNPNHSPSEQPRFQSRVRLSNGTIMPCTDYTVTAASGLPGFQYCTPTPPDTSFVAWRDWTEMAVDLSAYVGQTVTLEFETGDCKLGGHYGYAYIDGIQCGKTDEHVQYCSGQNQINITASSGFSHYQWETGDTTQTVTVNPNLYDTLSCTVTTFTGCVITLHYILDPSSGVASFTYTTDCSGVVQFTSISQVPYNPIYQWSFGSTLPNPTHTFTPGTTNNVTLTLSSGTGCIKDTTIPVVIPPPPKPSFNAPNVCLGDPTLFINTTSPLPGMVYLWDIGNGVTFSSTNPTYVYSTAGTYNITLTTTANGCSSTTQGTTIVYPLPIIIGPINHN